MLWSRCQLTDDLERWADPPYVFLLFSCQPTTYRQQCPYHFHSWPILPISCSAQGQYCELNSSISNLFTFSLKDQEWQSSGWLDWTRPNLDWMPVVEMGSCSEAVEVCSTLQRPLRKTLVMSRRLTTLQSKYRQHWIDSSYNYFPAEGLAKIPCGHCYYTQHPKTRCPHVNANLHPKHRHPLAPPPTADINPMTCLHSWMADCAMLPSTSTALFMTSMLQPLPSTTAMSLYPRPSTQTDTHAQ